jgi:hypothetical protein
MPCDMWVPWCLTRRWEEGSLVLRWRGITFWGCLVMAGGREIDSGMVSRRERKGKAE